MSGAALAPSRYESEARKYACPILSCLNDDGSVKRVACMVGACSLWDWKIAPHIGLDAKPREGFGQCSIPRRGAIITPGVTPPPAAVSHDGTA